MTSRGLVFVMVLLGSAGGLMAAGPAPAETSGGWKKFEGNPVLGGKYGTCATSPDGLTWKKYDANPIFGPEAKNPWERHKVAGVQVVKQDDWYLMFYIGYQDEPSARICLARSKDGITNWQRHPANPIIVPGRGKWDHDACYKPFAIFDGKNWLLWYNGRHGSLEQIGLVLHEGGDLGFDSPGD